MLVELDWLDSLYLVEDALTQMDHPEQTLAAKLYQEAQLSSQQEVAVALGHQYYKEVMNVPISWPVFAKWNFLLRYLCSMPSKKVSKSKY